MAILITGGAGFLGVALAHKLVAKGADVILFDIAPPPVERIRDINENIKFVQGDLTVWPEVLNVVKANNVQDIFHFGAMIGPTCDNNPWACFLTNITGTMHVLEAARLFSVTRVVFSSSLSTFGIIKNEGIVTDETLQRPMSMYGISKLHGELMGRFYRRKFGLDFRCLRYPSITGPGVRGKGLGHYNAWMIENAALGKAYECNVSEDTAVPVIYFKDAIRAAEMIYRAPKNQIKTICYNLSGLAPLQAAKQLELSIKKFIPEANITYKPDPLIMELVPNLNIKSINDSKAREEWGWNPLYRDIDKVVEDFIREVSIRRDLTH